LGKSPTEINQIGERLNRPSAQLAKRLTRVRGQPEGEIIKALEDLKELLEFKPVDNPGHQSEDKVRRFNASFRDRLSDIAWSHILEVSDSFPVTIFLIDYYDQQWSYTGKIVIRGGEVVQEVFDGDKRSQGLDWALLDIFAPFRAEYFAEQEFGSLWRPWLEAVMTAATRLLKDDSIFD